MKVYGRRNIWRQMGRENLHLVRCGVRKLMRPMGLTESV